MSRFCPAYPVPSEEQPSPWRMFFSKQRSWLDGLYVRSYTMKMGEVHLPGIDLFMINEPSLVREVLSDQATDFPKHPMLGDALRPLLGDSIFTTNGAVWQRQRRLMEPSFEAARVTNAYDGMLAAAEAMMDRLRIVPDGAEHDLEIEMTHVTADIILRTILSQPLDGPTAQRIFDAFHRFQSLAPRLMMPAVFGARWLRPWWRTGASRRAAEEIRSLLAELIRPRFDAHRRGDPPTDDLLASLLEARDEAGAPGFDFSALVDQVAMLFLAGHETSASALSWSLHLIANAPDVQERLHQESDRLGDKQLRMHGSLKDLPFTRDVFRETLRLFPPVGFLARQSVKKRRMRDKDVPAGSSVIVSPWLIHRHRKLWTRPEEFDPFRFSTDPSGRPACDNEESPSVRESLRAAYLPFGMGPRVCIGAAFALQEATLVLAMLMRHWHFEPVAGHVPVPVGRLTIRSANGIRLRMRQRRAGA